VFAATTGRAKHAPDLRDIAEIGMLAAECLARAVARGVYEAKSLDNAIAPRCWRDVYGKAS
jgi:D-aminopeptidase